MSGWIKMHRKINNSEIFSDPELFRLWTIVLTNASYKKKNIVMNGSSIELQPGEWVVGRKSLYETYNENIKPKNRVKDTTLWNWLKKLASMEMITISSKKMFSIVTIENWDEYQGEEENDADNESSEHGAGENPPSLADYRETPEEDPEEEERGILSMDKHLEKSEESKKSKPKKSSKDYVYTREDVELKLAGRLFYFMKQNNPKAKEPDPQKWADKFRLMIERDKRDPEDIALVIDWSQADDFWMVNILSPEKLRKQFDRLYMQMEKGRGKTKGGGGKLQRKNDLIKKMMEEEEGNEQKRDSETLFLD